MLQFAVLLDEISKAFTGAARKGDSLTCRSLLFEINKQREKMGIEFNSWTSLPCQLWIRVFEFQTVKEIIFFPILCREINN